MEEKYRLLFFKYLYDLLDLKKIEDELKSRNVDCVNDENQMCEEEKTCSACSKYFYLLNEINLKRLSSEELDYLNQINEETPNNDIQLFLEKTYQRVLLESSLNNKVYYGPFMNPRFEADSDSIAIGIKYEQFGLLSGNRKKHDEILNGNRVVIDIMKKVESLSTKYKLKLIEYNELYEALNRNDSFKRM